MPIVTVTLLLNDPDGLPSGQHRLLGIMATRDGVPLAPLALDQVLGDKHVDVFAREGSVEGLPGLGWCSYDAGGYKIRYPC